MDGTTEPLTGEILDEGAAMPRTHDVTPGWVGRNRAALDRARAVTRALMMVAPPPVRVPLALASLAADAAVLAEDARRRLDDPRTAGLRGVAVALEGAALLAASRYAPVRLAANLGAIEMARGVTARLLARRPRA